MTFLELLLVLLLLAVCLLQVARRVGLPYPAMLASAGLLVALVPGAPSISLDPATVLALFIAPALVEAAYDFPIRDARRLWGPVVAFAVFAVLATSVVVASVGVLAGLPLAAALALGAVVAPPDAAAATAVLSSVSIPRDSETVIRGESLFNDATALVLFGAALAVQGSGGLDGAVVLRIAVAAPFGVGLGVVAGLLGRHLYAVVSGTLGGTLLQFVVGMLVWVGADHLHASAVLAVVSYAMVIAATSGHEETPQVRIHSYAVWSTAVFVLNVTAFLLMGMQGREIFARLPVREILPAVGFAAAVLVAAICTRLTVVLAFNRFNALRHRRGGRAEPASWRQAVLVGWTGMRGLVTLATAFALPAGFPQRDRVVLAAFAVVIGTLVLQGLTLVPLIRLLGLRGEDGDDGRASAIRSMADAALRVAEVGSHAAGPVGEIYRMVVASGTDDEQLERMRSLALAGLAAERGELRRLAETGLVDAETRTELEGGLDLRQLALTPAADRRIEEG